MRVLTVYAHPNPKSFGHAVLLKAGAEQIAAAFTAAGGPSAAADALETLARTHQPAHI